MRFKRATLLARELERENYLKTRDTATALVLNGVAFVHWLVSEPAAASTKMAGGI